MVQVEDSLSDYELNYIRISQAWLSLLLRLAFDYPFVTDWKIGGWILDINNLFVSILNHHEEVTPDILNEDFVGIKELQPEAISRKVKTIKKLISWQEEPGLGAGNDKLKKYVSVSNANQNGGSNYAYLDTWDIEYVNAPKLNFVAKFDNSSLIEFEELFMKFLNVNNQEELNSFKSYLNQKYDNK